MSKHSDADLLAMRLIKANSANAELLEALGATLSAYIGEIHASGHGDTIKLDGTVKSARAAIAKATGA